MGKIIKKHSSFLYWVLVPCLLLVVSVFGVNLVSRPVYTGGASSPFSCSVDLDCNNNPIINPNGCRTFTCTSLSCEPLGIDLSKPGCGLCSDGITCNHNGVCEAPPENSANCDDCLIDLGSNSAFDLCVPRLVRTNFIGAVPNGISINPCSVNRNYCCPAGCVGDPNNTSLFDIDCACCGDSLTNSQIGEQCDPGAGSACSVVGAGAGTCTSQCQCTPAPTCGNGSLDPGESCDGSIVSGAPDPTNCKATCRVGANQDCTCCGDGVTQAADGEQCDPPNGTSCDTNCQTIPPSQPVCGNGIVETGEACEGTTCSVTQSDGSVIPGICQACQCLPQCEAEGSGCGNTGNTSAPCFAGTGGTGGSSLIPLPIHTTVLAQWVAALAVPGAVFTGLRVRRKKK